MAIVRKHILSFLFFVALSLIQITAFTFTAQPVLAYPSLINNQTGITEIGNVYGNSPLDIRVIIARIITIVLGFLATIFLALIIFAGFRYMTAAGNEEQTKKAVSQITSAVIGLAIVLASWTITYFIIRALDISTTGQAIWR